MKKRISSRQSHSTQSVAYATSLFFAVRRIMRTALSKNQKLDPSSWLRIETMKFIAENKQSKMKDVAEYLSITAPSATSLVNGLVKNGLVAGRTDLYDRRASRLVLTPKGKRELKRTIARGLKIFCGLFSVLTKSELEGFTRALKRIKEESAL